MATRDERNNDQPDQNKRPEEGQQAAPAEAPDTITTLQKQAEEAQKNAEQLKDQLLRKAAEFENYKRRVLNEQSTAARFANEEIMLALIPILNDFSRSLRSGQEQKNFEAFYKGIELIYHKLVQTLERQGLKPFDSVGKPFNVELHDALLQMPRSDVPPNTVIEEIERGFMLHDRVIRHARVVVSAEDVASSARTGDNDGKGRA